MSKNLLVDVPDVLTARQALYRKSNPSIIQQRTSFHLGPFYKHGSTLILAWISNHMPSEVWDEITYPIPKLQRCNRWSLGMDK